jgi:hypothetical protein
MFTLSTVGVGLFPSQQSSKFEVWFLLNGYCFGTITKLKICELDCHQLETICEAYVRTFVTSRWRFWKTGVS